MIDYISHLPGRNPLIYSIRHLPGRIPIGIQTEISVQAICFDVRPWIEQYGQLDFAVWPTRPGETTAYYAANVKLIEGILYWWPNGVDTAIPGNGKVEIIGITAEKRKLSGACETSIRATSLPTDPETPDANRPWVDEVIEAASRAHSSANSAAESADRAAQAAAEAGYMQFEIGDDGRLYYYRTDNVNVMFSIDEGRLMIYEQT